MSGFGSWSFVQVNSWAPSEDEAAASWRTFRAISTHWPCNCISRVIQQSGVKPQGNFHGFKSFSWHLPGLSLFIFPPSYLRAASRKEREGLLQINATSCGFFILNVRNLLFISYLQPVLSKSRSLPIYPLSLLTSNWIKKNVPILFSSEVCTSN